MQPEPNNTDSLESQSNYGKSPSRPKHYNSSIILLMGIALTFLILAAYIRVKDHQFLNFDDDIYITQNPHITSGLTADNICWAFSSLDTYNWHPITWISHMADVQLFGMNPCGHHLTNVVFHTISALLLFILLFYLSGAPWPSIFVATLFALHPLHVESVAWAAERKDVLSGFFWFLTLLLYSRYVTDTRRFYYVLSIFSFALGLMSKSMLVTLPLIMLLLDFWPLNRFSRTDRQGPGQFINRVIVLIKEKIPFFICSLFSGIITIYAQYKGGAVAGLSTVSIQHRCENALIAYVKYIGKTLWPHDLAILYPFPSFIPLWHAVGSLCILLLLTATCLLAWQRHPYLTVGWLWFLVTLVPVIGFIQVGGQEMADRYAYLSTIGLYIMAAWGIPELTKTLPHQKRVLTLLAGITTILLSAATWLQLDYWQDNISLYRHTLSVTTDNYAIHNNLGSALQADGDIDTAIQEYQKALRINPYYKNGRINLENALQARNDRDTAIEEYRKLLLITPHNMIAHKNLGDALASKGDIEAAIQEYQEALRIAPNDTDTLSKLKRALARQMTKAK